jgi:hypothetical protein
LKKRRDRRGIRGVVFFTQQAPDQGRHGQCESLCVSVIAYFRGAAAF